ncbi:hypothetical protein MKK69_05330 [Methylobacterium sp. J-026]|uniref:hypothetical protein n=1 Tax=Methylobacterium sp. J-026 TaxID=2836624 RepID=UPI001FB99E61|nr:hypothetical protein [Methylobacterium sp. J-026]MCJ2133492.1 hypothetical protein [Methylobacterium sp. J-026]
MVAPGVGASARSRVGVEAIMTEAGGCDQMGAASSTDERARLLAQIAEALQIPVSTFRLRNAGDALRNGPAATECAALLAAFSRIDDPDRRAKCLLMVEGFSER